MGLWESRQAGVFGWSLISVQVIIILSSNKIISLEVADFLSLKFLLKCYIFEVIHWYPQYNQDLLHELKNTHKTRKKKFDREAWISMSDVPLGELRRELDITCFFCSSCRPKITRLDFKKNKLTLVVVEDDEQVDNYLFSYISVLSMRY